MSGTETWDNHKLLSYSRERIVSLLRSYGSFNIWSTLHLRSVVLLLTDERFEKLARIAESVWDDYPTRKIQVDEYFVANIQSTIAGCKNRMDFRAGYRNEYNFLRLSKREHFSLLTALPERAVVPYNYKDNPGQAPDEAELKRILSSLAPGWFPKRDAIKMSRANSHDPDILKFRAVYSYPRITNFSKFSAIFFEYMGIEFEEWDADFWIDKTSILIDLKKRYPKLKQLKREDPKLYNRLLQDSTRKNSYWFLTEYKNADFTEIPETLTRSQTVTTDSSQVEIIATASQVEEPVLKRVKDLKDPNKILIVRSIRRIRETKTTLIEEVSRILLQLLKNPNLKFEGSFMCAELAQIAIALVVGLEIKDTLALEMYPGLEDLIHNFAVSSIIELQYPDFFKHDMEQTVLNTENSKPA